MKVLVTGICGNIGRLVAAELLAAGHAVIGIDRREWRDAPDGIEIFDTDLLKRPAEDVFRRQRPEAVVHLATLGHFGAASEERCRINLGGTKNVFDFCHRYGVGQAIFVGRHTYYGAAPDAVLYHVEDEPPLGLGTYPELADLVAADLYAGSALWRFPELSTQVLRLCYTLGPSAQGTLASYLTDSRVPMVMGFDPLFQFMHEHDAASAIALALLANARERGGLRGVFNVVGPAPVPLSVLVRETGRLEVPVPEPLFRLTLGRFGLPQLPKGATGHVKFPIVADGSAFCRRTGFRHRFDEQQTMADFRRAAPVDLD